MATQKAKQGKTLHIGAELDAELTRQFRAQCDERGFKQVQLLARLIEYWLGLPEAVQIDIYHNRVRQEDLLRDKVMSIFEEAGVIPPRSQSD